MAINKRKGKTYAVYCAPKLASAKALIKVALKKLPEGARLVVVTADHSDKEYEQAEKDGYTLITLQQLTKYGTEMLEIRQREKSVA